MKKTHKQHAPVASTSSSRNTRPRRQTKANNVSAGTPIPAHLQPYVTSFVNVSPDGHCGFRAIAVSLGRNESDWLWVRREMLRELNMRPDFYTTARLSDMLSMSLDTVRTRLNTAEETVADKRELWLAMPGFIGIIANAFSRPVLFYSTQKAQERVCYPYFSDINKNPPLILFAHLIHFYSITLDFSSKKTPIPRICPIWRRYKMRVDSANITWADQFHDSNNLYPEKAEKKTCKGATFVKTISSDHDSSSD